MLDVLNRRVVIFVEKGGDSAEAFAEETSPLFDRMPMQMIQLAIDNEKETIN